MTAIPIWPDNDRTFRLSGVKTYSVALGKYVTDDTLTITAFIALSDPPDAAAISGTTVTATSKGRGKYWAEYDRATNLPLSVLRAAVSAATTATLYLHWDCPGNFHVVQELAYSETRDTA